LGTGGKLLRRVRAGFIDEPTGFVWVEDSRLAASGYPASRSQVEWVVNKGITSVLTLTEYPIPKEWTVKTGLFLKHVPLRDHEPPSAEKLEECATFIEAELAAGRKVMVHCLAGEGRTGCVLAAYLIRTKKLGGERALVELRRIKPGFVEKKQEKAVIDFANSSAQGD